MGKHWQYNSLATSNFPAQGAIIAPDGNGYILGWGPSIPSGSGQAPDGVVGWAPSAIFIQTDATTLGTATYVNVGTLATAIFIQQVALGPINLAVPVLALQFAGATTQGMWVWVAVIPCTIVSIRFETQALGPAITLQVNKHTAAAAVAADTAANGTTVVQLTTFAANQVVTTVVNGTLSVVAGALNMATGDRLAIYAPSAPTSLLGALSINGYPT